MSMLLGLFLVVAFVLHGLLAVWMAVSPVHWFLRALGAVCVLAPLWFIPAYEPIVCFGTEVLSAATLIILPKRGLRRPRFALSDTMLVLVLVAAFMALMVQLPRHGLFAWGYVVVVGIVAGSIVALGFWTSRLRLWLGAVLSAVFLPLAAWVHFRAATLLREFYYFDDWFVILEEMWLPYFFVVGPPLLYFVVLAWCGLVRPEPGVPRREPRSGTRVILIGLTLAALLMPYLFVYWRLLNPTPILAQQLPNPNGHDDLTAAIRMLKSDVLDGSPNATPQQIKDEVKKHDQVFRRLELGLGRESAYPLKYTKADIDDVVQHNPRSLARALAAKASVQTSPNEAAKCHLDTIRLARAFERKGLYIHYLIGIAIEGMGINGLSSAYQGMSQDETLAMIDDLAEIAPRESLDEMKQREAIWSQHAYGWQGRLLGLLGSETSVDDLMHEPMLRARAQLRQLIIDMTITVFYEEHHRLPDSLQDLSLPDELLADPFSNGPMVYRPVEGGYELYSVGGRRGRVALSKVNLISD